ncbi:MAG: peptidoglycan DD-metalloendopeptidase family protein [Synergistales bacterium]|nr:peptidoglycan DD-metalloendopeptidase family protein [Synergistales bacterium]
MHEKQFFPGSFVLLALTVIIFMCFSGIPAESASGELEKKISREEKNMERLQKQVEIHKKAVREMKEKEEGVLEQLSVYDQKRKLAQQKIRLLELKQEKAQETIKDLQDQIQASTIELASMREMLRGRLVSIYKYGGTAELNLLVFAPSAHETLTTSFLLKKIARQDQEMIEEMEKKKRSLEDSCMEMEEQNRLLQEQSEELLQQKDLYQGETKKRSLLLSQLRKKKEMHLQAAKELERSQKEIQSKISFLLKKKRQMEEERKASSSVSRPSVDYFKPGSKLAWPVRGRVTSRFGTRVHPVFKTKIMHTGIDIDARRGDPVKAAESGEVLYAGWLRGYGQIIILDHGAQLTTVYAHLDASMVEEGESVKSGQTIGKVGSTGVATGAHLHFEVRVDGEARDPMKYL